MVVIIDYGMGNLKSVYNALNKIGCRCKVSSEVRDIRTASGLILPGVGAFKDCMDNLTKSNLDQMAGKLPTGRPCLCTAPLKKRMILVVGSRVQVIVTMLPLKQRNPPVIR